MISIKNLSNMSQNEILGLIVVMFGLGFIFGLAF